RALPVLHIPMLPPPPRRPVFPYPTRFRSLDEVARPLDDAVGHGLTEEHDVRLEQASADRAVAYAEVTRLLQIRVPVRSDLDLARDRQSTRLYSSHVKISYAVFCFEENMNG